MSVDLVNNEFREHSNVEASPRSSLPKIDCNARNSVLIEACNECDPNRSVPASTGVRKQPLAATSRSVSVLSAFESRGYLSWLPGVWVFAPGEAGAVTRWLIPTG